MKETNVFKKSINSFIKKYKMKNELNKIRKRLIPYAKKSGYFTDEDIFKDIS